MGDLKPYEIALLIQMYNERIIGKKGYTSLQKVRKIVKWDKIAKAYKFNDSFDNVARPLVKRKLLSDDGKSMEVLYLDKLGVDFVVGYLEVNPNAMKTVQEMLRE